jgi:mannose-6-phosphate isomerase-like protein (cupin superfamily)
MAATTRDPVHRASYSFQADGEDLVVDTWLEPGGALPPHLHPRQTEIWSVVEGEVRIQLGKQKRVITPADGGQTVLPNTVHGLESTGKGTAHLRCHVSPAYELQAFLEDSAAAAREGLFMKGGIPKSLKGARWAAAFLKRHQQDVVMTFPPAFAQRTMIRVLG